MITAKELDNETSYTYFGARYYDSELSGWLSVDPMSDKYPSLSPYCYSADNPVVLVDPNGNEIRIYYKEKTGIAKFFERSKFITYTQGMTYEGDNQFVKETVNAINYVSKGDKSNIIEQLINNKKIVKIKNTSIGNDRYNPMTNTAYYNTQSGLECVDENGNPTGEKQTPALGLYHELGHGHIDINMNKDEKKGFYMPDKNYDTKGEKYVIENFETPAAKILNEGTRNNHSGNVIKTKNSTSTEEVY